jgi:hypothetical protein
MKPILVVVRRQALSTPPKSDYRTRARRGFAGAAKMAAALAKSLHSLSAFRQGFPILGVQIGS